MQNYAWKQSGKLDGPCYYCFNCSKQPFIRIQFTPTGRGSTKSSPISFEAHVSFLLCYSTVLFQILYRLPRQIVIESTGLTLKQAVCIRKDLKRPNITLYFQHLRIFFNITSLEKRYQDLLTSIVETFMSRKRQKQHQDGSHLKYQVLAYNSMLTVILSENTLEPLYKTASFN